MPLRIFVKCSCEKDLKYLVRSGAPTEAQLAEAWVNIVQEYSDAIGSHEYRLYLSLYKEVSLLKIDYEMAKAAIEILELCDDNRIKDSLNKILMTTFKFGDNKFEELRKCKSRIKNFKIQIDLKVIQFNEIEKKNRGVKKEVDEKYYESLLITLSDYAKYRIIDSISVFEFCERIKRLNAYHETLKKKK